MQSYRYSICVSGAAGGDSAEDSHELARRLGAAIAQAGHITVTGATVGLPYYAAMGAKDSGGTSIGYSPAATVREHLRKYRLPCNYFDYISYTGSHYMGRDLQMIQSCDAILTAGGRLGTLNEFILSVEQRKPVGVLVESGGSSDMIPQLLNILQPEFKKYVIFDDNPEILVQRIIKLLDEDFADIKSDLTVCFDWIDQPTASDSHQG